MSPNYLITLEPACLEGARITREAASLKSLVKHLEADLEAGKNEKTESQMKFYRKERQAKATIGKELLKDRSPSHAFLPGMSQGRQQHAPR